MYNVLSKKFHTDLQVEGKELKKTKILVVDDSPTILNRIQEELGEKYEVSTCTDWIQANRLVHHFRPDVVIIDENLGDFNGSYLTRSLRAFFKGQDSFVIIAISAEKGNERAALDAGANIFLHKSLLDRLGDLVGRIEKCPLRDRCTIRISEDDSQTLVCSGGRDGANCAQLSNRHSEIPVK